MAGSAALMRGTSGAGEPEARRNGRGRPVASPARGDGDMDQQTLIANIAVLYYKAGLTQNEIAARTRLSRATVVNYLKIARDSGIVEIRVQGAAFAGSDLSRRLQLLYDLEDVFLARSPALEESGPDLAHLGQVGAMALYDMLLPGDVLGVAWGETVLHTVDALPRRPIEDLHVVQIIGSMPSPRLPAAETCTTRIATRMGAACHTLHAPALLSSEALAVALRAEPTIHAQLGYLDQLSIALFSVGSCRPDTHLVASGIAAASDLDAYVQAGAVGILGGRFINERGQPLSGHLDGRMVGIDLPQLMRVPRRLLVAAGEEKLAALRAALASRLATHLVTDEATAQALLSSGGA